MSKDQEALFDSIRNLINDQISNQNTLTLDYSFAMIFKALHPFSPSADYFLAKIFYIMEYWPKAEIHAIESIKLLENKENKSKYEEIILGDMLYCKSIAEAYLNKPTELNETLNYMKSKYIYKERVDKIEKRLNKFDQTCLTKYVMYKPLIY